MLVAALVADPQPAAAQQPGDGAFDRPAVTAKSFGGVDAAAGDTDLDAPPLQVGPAAAVVVGLVGVDLVGSAAPATCRGRQRRDVVQDRREQGAVVRVGGGEQDAQRDAAAVDGEVELAAGLAAVGGVCAGVSPFFRARRLVESTLTRRQSIRPASPKRSSSRP